MTRPWMLPLALLSLCLMAAHLSAAPFLVVDVNDRTVVDTPNTVAGFQSYVLNGGGTATITAPSTLVIGAYSVTLSPFDDHLDENTLTAGVQDSVGAIDDRDRATPVDGGALAYAQIYDDLIFAGTSTGPTGGMNLAISGGVLQPNTPYSFSIYAFDSGSTPAPQPRTANWLDGNNANALVFTTSFSGGALPTTDFQYRVTGTAITDAAGALLLLGRNTSPNDVATGATSIGVFINGFEVDQVPEPTGVTLALLGIAALGLRRPR